MIFLENTDINEIENKRLVNFRRKCENYNFKISYNPGLTNTADPLSRGEVSEETFIPRTTNKQEKKENVAALLIWQSYYCSSDELSEFEMELIKDEKELCRTAE